jgi:predicted SnoaL-like aldol condensation-catalyzing enzyme
MSSTADVSSRKREYEQVVTRFRNAVIFKKDYTRIYEVLTTDFVDHFAPPWDPPGRQGVESRFDHAADALTTRKVEVLVSVCEGDILSQAILLHFEHTGEFMGIPATGRRFAIGGSNTFRFQDGKIAEHWGVFDVAKIPDILAPQPGATGGWASMWGDARPEAVSAD